MQLVERYENLIFEDGKKIMFSRKINADFTGVTHWHPFVEVLLCLEEGNEVTVNFTSYHPMPNDILILYPGDLHAIRNVSPDSFLILQFSMSLLNILTEFDTLLPELTKHTYFKYDPKQENHDRLILLFKNIFHEETSTGPFQELPLYIKLLNFFDQFAQVVLSELPTDTSDSNLAQYKSAKLMAEACLYISQNCASPLTLESVSHQIGISKSYFAHLFKDYTKMTFIDFLTQERIKRSETLFLGSRKKIIDIAFECGFTSMSSFNRAFKKIKGISPTQFRESLIAKAN